MTKKGPIPFRRKWQKKIIRISGEEIEAATAVYLKNGGMITNLNQNPLPGRESGEEDYQKNVHDFLNSGKGMFLSREW